MPPPGKSPGKPFVVSGLPATPEEWASYEIPDLYILGTVFFRQGIGTGLWLSTWQLGLKFTDTTDGVEYEVVEQPEMRYRQQRQMLLATNGSKLEFHPRGNGGLKRTRKDKCHDHH